MSSPHDLPTSDSFGRHVFELFLSFYVLPEVQERQKSGQVPTPFPISAAQILFVPGTTKPLVRLNDEVTAIAKVQLKEGTSKQAGDPIYFNELESVEDAEPAPAESGSQHVTLFLLKGVWTVAFGFAFNPDPVKEHLDAADQFLLCAKEAASRDHRRAASYNLFCTAELLAKTSFLVLPNAHALEFDHRPLKNRYNLFRHAGLPFGDYAETFNRLHDLRKPARYLTGRFDVLTAEIDSLLRSVEAMRDEIKARTQPAAQ